MVKPVKFGPNHFLVKALINKGMSVRESRKFASILFTRLKEEVMRGNTVELSCGSLKRILENRPKRRRYNFVTNRPEYVYKRKYRVIFEPKEL